MKKFKISNQITLYRYGKPYDTETVLLKAEEESMEEDILYLKSFVSKNDELIFTYEMTKEDVILGLGQNMGGINKRGKEYISFSTDDPNHLENNKSLYGIHPFFIVDGEECFGVFIDYPGKMSFDIGYRQKDCIQITIPKLHADLYIIEGNKQEIIKAFMTLVGKSYVPPKWAFGYQQSRWSYPDSNSIEEVVENMRMNEIPCDAIYLDIDYMTDFKDFTIDGKKFPNFKEFVTNLKSTGIRLIPIIDAGVKVEEAYDVYEEGIKNSYFSLTKDKKPFIAAVWPGHCVFPDFLNPETRKWWGGLYKKLTDLGIEGFWNDMNEPALFYTPEKLKEAVEKAKSLEGKNLGIYDFFGLKDSFTNLSNLDEDYKKIYHKDKDGNFVNHYDVHNLYGYNMTRAASEGFDSFLPDKRVLLFSRASYQGAHRYGGIWTGDNKSWWSHLLLNIQMIANLNMCGFLYSGADIGGFGDNCNEELIIRWMQFGIFTPLLRNHSAMGTRHQEPYSFGKETMVDLRNIIKFRYALLPYIYSEFMKARRDMKGYILPLSIEYSDKRSKTIEDQILCGESLMLAPIYTANARGRYVYLPEDMLLCKLSSLREKSFSYYTQGDHYIPCELEEMIFFIRPDKAIILGKELQHVHEEVISELTLIVYLENYCTYEYYDDDGYDKNLENSSIMEFYIEETNEEIEIKVNQKKENKEIKRVIFEIYSKNKGFIKKSISL